MDSRETSQLRGQFNLLFPARGAAGAAVRHVGHVFGDILQATSDLHLTVRQDAAGREINGDKYCVRM